MRTNESKHINAIDIIIVTNPRGLATKKEKVLPLNPQSAFKDILLNAQKQGRRPQGGGGAGRANKRWMNSVSQSECEITAMKNDGVEEEGA